MLLGIAIGDALGVPYEFSSREQMLKAPAKDMVGFKTHNQPAGTWSDDSSLTFCLAEALIQKYTLEAVAINFVKWKNEAYWTAHNEVFDIGMTTAKSISELETILANGNSEEFKRLKYAADESDNGNGSLMRILPLIFEIYQQPIKAQFEVVWENSALTHKHIRAAMSCMIYLKFAEYLINGLKKEEAYFKTKTDIVNFWKEIDFSENEQVHFKRLMKDDIRSLNALSINAGGYVIESLEASFWSFLTSTSFEECVLKSINFGHDTDTTAAIAGGLAGLYYGGKNIPPFWLASLAKFEEITELGKKLDEKYK
ncbi:ADP-ribosylglycohydrolase family protein [Flammeovirgaceae bacterium SG7u.111]|nr:ADP-ribosylglycohydrolase family protein [Flammeovirgaceae bacterium SG7u.111]